MNKQVSNDSTGSSFILKNVKSNNSGLIKIVVYVQAVKEMSMEKALHDLDVTWSSMEFEHEKHTHTPLSMLKTSEELLGDTARQPGMFNSRDVAGFLI